jgi:exosome complex RNA-binding protein Rrp4
MLWAQVPHVLIRRTKQRFHALPADVGVSMLVAANGLVWLSPADDAPADAVPAPDAMRRVARVRNSILLLAQAFIQVRPPKP